MFLNQQGKFKDISLNSGIDFRQDGRGFAITDFDNDGRLDLAIVSCQSPRFRFAKMPHGHPSHQQPETGAYVKVKLIGGNRTATPSRKLSPRDPVGAVLVARSGSTSRMFQMSRGEGFAIQNSSTIHIGLGTETQIDELEIRWPSGKITREKAIEAGSTVEIFEPPNSRRHVSEEAEKG